MSILRQAIAPLQRQRRREGPLPHEWKISRDGTFYLKVRIRPEQDPIPLVVQNLKGYDAHLLFQEISKIKDKKLECIPQNGETNISFSLGGLRFIDSLNFLQESLDSLAKNLPTEALKYTAELAKNKTQRRLTEQKRVYPYEYI